MRRPDGPPPDRLDTFDGAGLTLYRLWHPSEHQPHGLVMRTFGPLYRLDPHPPGDDGGTTDHGDRGPAVWYGSLVVDTAVCEVLARGDGTYGGAMVEVCPELRVTVAAVPDDANLPTVDLTDGGLLDAAGIPDGVGDDIPGPGEGYADTQAWARWLEAVDGVAAARYWSARHRDADGSRRGVNTAVWDAPDGWREHARHRAIDDAVWVYVEVALDAAGVAWQQVTRCPRCPEV